MMCVPGCADAVQRALSRRRFFAGAAATGFGATAATSAQAQRSFSTVLDLTHTLSPEFPTFFGLPGITIERRYTFRRDGANVNWWHVVEHAGTHVDAPFHYSETGPSAEAIPAGDLVVPLAVVDVSAKAARNADYAMTPQDLAEWEAKHGRLPDGCCVAMNAGWARHAADAAKFTGKDAAGTFHFPGIAPAAAAWLIKERRVTGLAVDTLSLDVGTSKDFPTHKAWLPSGRWGIENIANLDRVPASGATLVVGLPKVKGASGGPARVLALI
jgi:kynurenine formamidase